MPTTHIGLIVVLRNAFISKSVPMFPEPTIAALIIEPSPSHKTK
jgi:hypothetical protein